MKLFIDTNKYLDFYRYQEENIEILNKLAKCDDILITEQVVDEFRRNRNKELHNLMDYIHEINTKINNVSIKPIGIYSEQIKYINNKTLKNVQDIKAEITNFENMISDIIDSKEKDIVDSTFTQIINNKNTRMLKHDDISYQKAIKRNHLGGIPRSEKNGFRTLTVCDEYIWETLLSQSKYDICFVTRDKTYLDNKDLLAHEYQDRTGKKIWFVDTVSEGFTYIGLNVSKYASEVENINNYDLKCSDDEKLSTVDFQNLKFNSVQQDIFDTAVKLANKAVTTRKKNILIVSAPTGCGKTSLATNLLVQFVEKNYKATFVTSSSVSRNLFYEKLKGRYRYDYIKNLCSGSGAFIEMMPNTYDCLIVDDAHRLHSKSGLFHNMGENQIKEIIHASLFSIFFIDENQKITLDDIGEIDLIKKYGCDYDAEIYEKKISIEYYLRRSNNYLIWLNHILENTTLPDNFKFNFDFKVFDDPNAMRDLIFEKNKQNGKSRLLAGYCWDWVTKNNGNQGIHDIVIPEHNFEMSWNSVFSKNWCIEPESINEVGSIYVVQGLELDYVGIIIGDDMRYENGRIVTDYTKRAKTDQSFKGINKKIREGKEAALLEVDTLIKNTYRVLMTRGIQGCYIYCTDKSLGAYFKEQLTCYNTYVEE